MNTTTIRVEFEDGTTMVRFHTFETDPAGVRAMIEEMIQSDKDLGEEMSSGGGDWPLREGRALGQQ